MRRLYISLSELESYFCNGSYRNDEENKEVVNNTPSARSITCIITLGWASHSGP